jgi:DNA-3-methyladenine glycosylase II
VASPITLAPLITLTPQGPFSLAASAQFLEGFGPARYRGTGDGVLRLAFPVETPGESWPVVGVAVRQQPDGTVVADATQSVPDGAAQSVPDGAARSVPDGAARSVPDGAAESVPDGVRARASAQLARLLSLDVDGTGFPALGASDPVVAGLQVRFPGLRPVCFNSPYEAACWAVLSHRVRTSQAATLKARLAAAHGERRTVDGVEITAFPDPAALLAVDAFDGVPDVKLRRLHALAAAAADGRLTAGRLRALPPAEALAELQRLPGVGPFSAELTLIRGAGAPDVFAMAERRLHATMVELYRLPGAEPARLVEVARGWAPYRSWVSVLARSYREAGARAPAAYSDRPTELPAGQLSPPSAAELGDDELDGAPENRRSPRIPAFH